MLAYFLKINVAIALFYAFYRLFFYKDTFFTWRRAALLCFLAVSAAYPLLNIQTWITEQEPMVAVANLYADIILPEFTITPEQTATDWKTILLGSLGFIYWGGVVLLTARFLIQLTGIIRLSFRCRKMQIENKTVHLLKQPEGPFSFFHWVFIYPASHTQEELSEILTHERTHANQWHSIDVLISEMACTLCWFNPFAWLMKREIRTNLEYLADNRVLETGHDSRAYQYHLLGLSHQKVATTIYNSFNVLPLKKRIKMMNKQRTREIGRAKYLIFLPLAALLMIISNIEAVARTTKEVAKDVIGAMEENLTNTEVTTKTVRTEAPALQQKKDTLVTNKKQAPDKDDSPIFEVVEVLPQYPQDGVAGLMKFLSENIKYPAKAHENGIQGRVMVQFVVNKDGSISNIGLIRGVNPELDSEAMRVIGTMPKWIPGKQKGKPVRVKYTIPVMFRLTKNEDSYTPIPEIDEMTVVGYAPQGDATVDEPIFEVVEQMPSFPGGGKGLMQFLSQNVKYPVEAQKSKIQGQVILQIVVDKNGYVTSPKVIHGVDPLLDTEAIRIAAKMPRWKPGMQRGQAVNVKYTFPISFKLQ